MSKLQELGEITHIFYAALQMQGNLFEEIAPNLAMLRHTVEAVERSSAGLRKVVLLEGAKYYGAHLGPYKTPAKESDPRQMPPNFYYDQEDYLAIALPRENPGHGRRCALPPFAALR